MKERQVDLEKKGKGRKRRREECNRGDTERGALIAKRGREARRNGDGGPGNVMSPSWEKQHKQSHNFAGLPLGHAQVFHASGPPRLSVVA